MPAVLLSKANTEDVPIDHTHFFGDIYAATPDQFKFNRGERILILEIAVYVNKVINGEVIGINNGIQHFANCDKRYRKKVLSNKHQGFIGVSSEASSSVQMDAKIASANINAAAATTTNQNILNRFTYEQIKSKLYHTTTKMLQKLPNMEEISVYDVFDESMVLLKIDKDCVQGSTQCFFCKRAGTRKIISAFFQIKGENFHWITTNLKKHIQKCHLSVRIRNKNKEKGDLKTN